MADEISLKQHEKLAVDPARVTVNHAGFCWRDFLVRLPKEAVADDLKEPDLWRKVQATPKAFRRLDHLLIVSFDETWIADATVAEADGRKAILSKPRIVTFPERFDRFFEDDNYRVDWNGAGYVVVRKSDGKSMTQPTANAALAERDLANLYQRRA